MGEEENEIMATVIEEFASREDRDVRYKALKAAKQKHVSRFSTSKLHEFVVPETGEIKNVGVNIWCLAIGV